MLMRSIRHLASWSMRRNREHMYSSCRQSEVCVRLNWRACVAVRSLFSACPAVTQSAAYGLGGQLLECSLPYQCTQEPM